MAIRSATIALIALIAGSVLIAAASARADTGVSSDSGLSDSQKRCLAEASRVRSEYMRHFGGDHVLYHFGARSDEAAILCREGKVGAARNLMAAIKFDIRALYNEQRFLD